MDGILEELLRLEKAKNHALIHLDPSEYDRAVQEQLVLIEDPRIREEALSGTRQLRAFSKLARINSGLFHNLLSTSPWLASALGYTGRGRLADASPAGGFSAEA